MFSEGFFYKYDDYHCFCGLIFILDKMLNSIFLCKHGLLKGLSQFWVLAYVTLNGYIMMWFVGSQVNIIQLYHCK